MLDDTRETEGIKTMTETPKQYIDRALRSDENKDELQTVIHLYIDETKDDLNTNFAMSATATDKPDEFVRISQMLRTSWERHSIAKYGATSEDLRDKIPKYSGSPNHVKEWILGEIASTGARTYGVHIDRSEDEGWKRYSASGIQKRQIRELTDIAFDDLEDKSILVIMEQSSDYSENITDYVERRGRGAGKKVFALLESSKTGDHKEGLHMADFVTGALGEYIKTGSTDKIDIVGMKGEKNEDRIMADRPKRMRK